MGRSLATAWPWLLLVAAALALPALLALIPGIATGYVLYLVALAFIYAIVALGLNLLIGYAGQFSLGQAGFMAIGAYVAAILSTSWGWPFVLTLPAAAVVSAAVGYLLGLPALRLSGPYLAVVTLGFGLAVPQLIIWQGSWTGGSSGLHNIEPAGLLGLSFATDGQFYYLALLATALLTLFTARLVKSRTGRAFIAIRDSELAAQAMGVSLLRYKTMAFALSAAYAGIAGCLYAYLLKGVGPEDFTLLLSVEFLAMVVVGGLGTIEGSLLGAAVLTALPNVLTRLPLLEEYKNLYVVVFGAILILTVIFMPRGIAGAWRSYRARRITTPEIAGQPSAVKG